LVIPHNFFPYPLRFRGWTGVGREAGSWQGDAIRNIIGQAGIGAKSGIAYPLAMDGNSGALRADGSLGIHSYSTTNDPNSFGGLRFDSSYSVPTAEDNHPVNVAIPVCMYLGIHA